MIDGTVRGVVTAIFALSLHACGSGNGNGEPDDPTLPLRIYYNPYGAVDWNTDHRLLAQHHDHSGTSQTRLSGYDRAGYHVVGLQNYSGNRSLSYAWTARRWPPEQWVSSAYAAALANIRFFIPNAEEVGLVGMHFTSPFLTTYIEVAPAGQVEIQPWQYRDLSGMINLVTANGGVPCLAHPWEPLTETAHLSGLSCVEMYTAFAEGRREQADPYFTSRDRNAILLENWDRLLDMNPRVLGIAVNDHFGPDAPDGVVSNAVRDSGKILVLVPETSLSAYEASFRRGAFFAIREQVTDKGQYPYISSISVEKTSIYIDTAGTVLWFANGRQVGNGHLFNFTNLPRNSTYLRAEIRNDTDSVVYSQAFTLKPVGDSDGDGDVDAQDRAVCDHVRAGTETQIERVSACEA